MTKELAMFLVECSENAGNEASLREDYSGRGMYGRTTCGVVVDSVSMLLSNVLTYMVEHISENVASTEYDGIRIPDVSVFSIDNMGNQTILY